jgi:HEAT repeat protein
VGPGLADKADAQVRRLSAEALQQVAVALADVIGDIRTSEYTPPEGRPLTEREKKDLELFAANVQAERKEVRPLLVALQGQMKALAQAVSDPSADVRILARGALEAIAHTRDRLLRKEENIQRAQRAAGPPENKQGRRLPQAPVVLAAAAGTPVKLQDDVLLDGFQQSKAVSALAAGLMDRDERARLAAVHALEMLGKDGAVAAPALVRSLTDPDRFVRWAAARALGKMAPADAESAVPALARLLSDSDLDLRLAAATALDLYGPEAKAAVPALAESVSNGDAESRIAALRALEGIGGAADAAVPAIARAMIENPDVRVRRTAAEVLGRFGPRADQAIPALRKALDDPDTSVRKAASEALLNIKPVQ